VADRPQLRVLGGQPSGVRRQRRARLLAVVAIVVAAVCLFGVVVAHVVLTQNQFRLDQLQQQSAARQAEYDRLRLQVAELESPDRIVAEAQQRLGMVSPTGVTYLAPTLDDEVVVAGKGATPEVENQAGASWSTVKPHLAEG